MVNTISLMLKYLTTLSLCAGPHLVTQKNTSQCLSVSRSVSLISSHGPSTCTDSVTTNNHYWIMHFLQRSMCVGKLRSTCTQGKVTHSTNLSQLVSKEQKSITLQDVSAAHSVNLAQVWVCMLIRQQCCACRLTFPAELINTHAISPRWLLLGMVRTSSR